MSIRLNLAVMNETSEAIKSGLACPSQPPISTHMSLQEHVGCPDLMSSQNVQQNCVARCALHRFQESSLADESIGKEGFNTRVSDSAKTARARCAEKGDERTPIGSWQKVSATLSSSSWSPLAAKQLPMSCRRIDNAGRKAPLKGSAKTKKQKTPTRITEVRG